MSKRYIFIVFILVSIIFALLLLPKVFYCSNDDNPTIHYSKKTCQNVNPQGLLLEAINTHRYIDSDKLAEIIVGEDPSYVFVDLRDANQFKKYSLPRAVNIPHKKVLDEKHHSFFASDDYMIVLFANGTVIADQVWSILRRKGFKNIMVLDGGLNEFFQTVLNPSKPKETDSKQEQDLYNYRKAAGIYFGLPNPDEFIPEPVIETVKKVSKPRTNNTTKKKVVVKAKKKVEEEEEEEGC